MTDDLRHLIPVDKHDLGKVDEIAKLGYPAISPILPDLLYWMSDRNWPIARELEPVIARIGADLVPYIRAFLQGEDGWGKYNLLITLVDGSPELAAALKPDLERLAANPTPDDKSEEVDQIAQEILEKYSLA